MSHVFLDISLSLDGFAAGPDTSHEHPLGRSGDALQAWLFGRDGQQPNETDQQAAQEMFSQTGAFIIGRTTYDVGVPEWGEDGAFGMPCFVMTHRLRGQHVMGPTAFNFVNEGPQAVLAKARAEAGGKAVCVMGGATTARQFVEAGLLDELRIHIAPVLLGQGTRLFETLQDVAHLQAMPAVSSPLAIHLRFNRQV
ncbi:dihydrofolate reductase family protein [Rhizobium sp. PL01]|uniref:dihydrofolate reductase family protein n=1 Tax=Rhizobium sp. PL01 TaxID=3085631 RepID=UPI0029814BD9|nr:dihydrofolate reductase family protein [Rhizobium sp. PL01]MDW5313178.1 dihydrofolate reductase family protein [Rhizobium sp. PL01]